MPEITGHDQEAIEKSVVESSDVAKKISYVNNILDSNQDFPRAGIRTLYTQTIEKYRDDPNRNRYPRPFALAQ